jgi:hypothetical protein
MVKLLVGRKAVGDKEYDQLPTPGLKRASGVSFLSTKILIDVLLEIYKIGLYVGRIRRVHLQRRIHRIPLRISDSDHDIEVFFIR